MRILLSLHAHLGMAGGASGVTKALGAAYQRLGHEVVYSSFDDLPNRLPNQAHQLLLPWKLARSIHGLGRHGPIDVVDASTGDASMLLALRNVRPRHGPLVATRTHGLEHTVLETHLRTLAEADQSLSWKYNLYHGTVRLRLVSYSLRKADLALFLNPQEREYATTHLKVAPERAHVVANGLDAALLNVAFAQEPSDGARGIAQIGSYIPRKGIAEGAAAMNVLLQRHQQVHLTFVGTGCPRETVLRDFDPNAHDRVRVIAKYAREDLPSLLANHQIKLFPSYAEGSSLALIEAMACGLAPVASAIPGNLTVVEHEQTGLAVPPRDSGALLNALERLVSDTALLRRLRANAHRLAQSFGWRPIAESTINLYRDARAQRARSW